MQDYIKNRIEKIKKHILKGGKYNDLTLADFMLAKAHISNFNDIGFIRRDK